MEFLQVCWSLDNWVKDTKKIQSKTKEQNKGHALQRNLDDDWERIADDSSLKKRKKLEEVQTISLQISNSGNFNIHTRKP